MLKYKHQKANKYLNEDEPVKQVRPDLIVAKQMVQQIGKQMAYSINNIHSTVNLTQTKNLIASAGRVNYQLLWIDRSI